MKGGDVSSVAASAPVRANSIRWDSRRHSFMLCNPKLNGAQKSGTYGCFTPRTGLSGGICVRSGRSVKKVIWAHCRQFAGQCGGDPARWGGWLTSQRLSLPTQCCRLIPPAGKPGSLPRRSLRHSLMPVMHDCSAFVRTVFSPVLPLARIPPTSHAV